MSNTITVTCSKTIQERQYEPLQFSVTVTRTDIPDDVLEAARASLTLDCINQVELCFAEWMNRQEEAAVPPAGPPPRAQPPEGGWNLPRRPRHGT